MNVSHVMTWEDLATYHAMVVLSLLELIEGDSGYLSSVQRWKFRYEAERTLRGEIEGREFYRDLKLEVNMESPQKGTRRCAGCGRFLAKDSYYENRCSDCWTPEDEFI